MLTFPAFEHILGNVTFQMYFEIKMQVFNATHRLEWPKSGTLTPPSADEDKERQEVSFIAGRVPSVDRFSQS